VTTTSEHIQSVDWEGVGTSLTNSGYAKISALLSPEECAGLIALYEKKELFRSRIDMAQYRFGRGEYQYFRYPLPALIEELRQSIYPRLVSVANTWAGLFQREEVFPDRLDDLLSRCHEQEQVRPTPLLLRYREGDFNCLHQDIYGKIAFPFQVVFFLSQPGEHYSGGEFLLTEQVPRAQTMGRAFLPQQGDALVITTRHRPAKGVRGVYKTTIRHGVSPVTAGERWTLGIIFHDAE
jgi:hypothetical protein